VPAERVELLPAPQHLNLAALADDGPLRGLALGRAVHQQAPAAVLARADRRRAEHPDGQRLQPLRQRGVIDIDVDGAQAVAEDAGVERVPARRLHRRLGRFAPRACLPSAAERPLVVGVERDRPVARFPEAGAKAGDVVSGVSRAVRHRPRPRRQARPGARGAPR
jgi:hypothetical protein